MRVYVYRYIYIYTHIYIHIRMIYIYIVVSRHDARFVASISPHHISSTIYISCSIIFHHHIFHSSPISTISSTIVPIFSHSSSFFVFPFHVSIVFSFIFPFIFIFILSIIFSFIIFIFIHSIIATNLASCLLIEKIGKKE